MGKKQITIDAPAHPVVRYSYIDERHIFVDMRGIRCTKGNLNGKPNPSKGTKRRYMTPEHLQCMVDEYFESCNGPALDKNGFPVYDRFGNVVKTQVRPWTVSGLALYLGIHTETLRKYTRGQIDTLLDEMLVDTDPNHQTYALVVSRAKQKIEAYAEGRLYDHDGQRGAQFVLDRCYGWVGAREQAEIDRLKAEIEIKQREFELKQQEFEIKKKLMEIGEEDSNFTINIVRGGQNTDD